MLTEKDLKQIAERGISEKQVEAQLKQIAEGFPFLKLEAAASTEKGILAPSNDEKAQEDVYKRQAEGTSHVFCAIAAIGASISNAIIDFFIFRCFVLLFAKLHNNIELQMH